MRLGGRPIPTWRSVRGFSGAMLVATASVTACGTVSSPSILTGRASAAEGAISITTDDWTYAVPLDGVRWVDQANSWHESGRPDCLQPGPDREVTFAAVQVTVEGSTWRPVVWVSCR